MALIEKTFLHYFDIHYLDEKGLRKIPNKIYFEAFFATRFAILCSDKVFLPAASYFESPICRKIIDQYLNIVPLGIIWLVGKAHNYSEFFQSKALQYANRSDYKQIYETALINEIEIPFHRRVRSSTKDITSNWLQILDLSAVPKAFECCHGLKLPSNLEDKWRDVPELLGNNAFIVQNVAPLLFSEKLENLAAINHLHSIINRAYFQSYVNELDAAVVSDLVVLEPNYSIANKELNIPYSYLLQEISLRNKIDRIKNCHPDDLIKIRESEDWIDVFYAALHNKKRNESDLEKFESLPLMKGQDIKIYRKTEINMGDTYNIRGQAGAVGPGAHAHDTSFNQIWNEMKNELDFEKVSEELARLRSEAQKIAKTPEELVSVGEIASAEIAAKEGSGPKMLEHLKNAGKWTLDIATNIGSTIAAEVIKKSMGL